MALKWRFHTLKVNLISSGFRLITNTGRVQTQIQKQENGLVSTWGPVHTYPDIFESATFSFRIWLPSTHIRRIRIFLIPLSRVEKNKSATNLITCGRVNPDIFESDDVENSCPVSYRTIWWHNICCHYRALYGACSEHFIAEKPWVPEWIRIPSWCVWKGEFDLNTLRVDGEMFQSGKKKLRIKKYPDTCGRAGT